VPVAARGRKRQAPVPVQADERARILELHGQGKHRNEIARLTGRSTATVSRVVKAAGGEFDAAQTAQATKVAVIDRAARRAVIIDRLYRRAETVLDRLEAAKYTHRVNAGEASFLVDDPAPPAQDERNLSSAISGYLSNATKLETVDQDAGNTARSVLGDLSRALGVAAEAFRDEPPPP
jgi:hypothetical protein